MRPHVYGFHVVSVFLWQKALVGGNARAWLQPCAAERERERARGLQTVRVQPITGQAEITEHNVNFTFIAPDQAFRN